MPRPVVVLDLGASVAYIGDTTVLVDARPGGSLAVGARVIRPLSFGERWRLLDSVAGTSGTRLGAVVLAYASGRSSGRSPIEDAADEVIAQILALHLAGARPGRIVPGFARQLASLIVAGWPPRQVLDADADLVDLLTVDAAGDQTELDSGWTSIVLVADEPVPGSLAAALRALERDLLDRVETDHSGESPAGTPVRSQRPSDQSVLPVQSQRPPDQSVLPLRTRPESTEVDAGPGHPGALSEEPRHRSLLTPADPSLVSPAEQTTPVTELHGAPTIAALPSLSVSEFTFSGLPTRAAVLDPSRAGSGWTGIRGPEPSGMTFPMSIRAQSTLWAEDLLDGRMAGTTRFPPPIAVRTECLVAPVGDAFAARATQAGSSIAPTVVEVDPTASRASSLAPPDAARPDAFDVADQLAALLDEESDLRGLRR